MQKTLTPQKKKILDFINSYSEEKGYSPSQNEVRKKLKLRSISTINQHLQELNKMGFIKKPKNQQRAIMSTKEKGTIEIPILGNIAAGQPIEAIEIPDETITIPRANIGIHGHHYALRVKGDSMIDEGIFDGDVVIIREQKTAEDGQTVVAIVDDNKATLKKFYKESKIKKFGFHGIFHEANAKVAPPGNRLTSRTLRHRTALDMPPGWPR